MNQNQNVLRDLLEAVETAIQAGDWKVDGTCDPDLAIRRAKKTLAQPEREWVSLTDEEIYDYADKFLYQHGSNYGIKSFGKAIEDKLKEKNGG